MARVVCGPASQGFVTPRGGSTGGKWAPEEHHNFLQGLATFGPGDWCSIARFSVRTRDTRQILVPPTMAHVRTRTISSTLKRLGLIVPT